MAEIVLNAGNFEQEVLASREPVLVDFWASWCGPCRMLAPVLAELAEDYEGKVKVGKVNVDDEQELALRYRVSAIPTVILFRDGQAVQTALGYQPKAALEAMLQ
jgi:thioredoxin 1